MRSTLENKVLKKTMIALLALFTCLTAWATNQKTIDTYNTSCVVCHASGVAGAPTAGDVAAWKPRLDKGMDKLLEHTNKGFNAMPPKGACVNCTDDDYKALIHYMAQDPTKS